MPRKKTKSTKSQSTNRPRKTVSFLEKSQVGISLTPQAVKNLSEIVESTGLSKSEVVESLVTGNLAIASEIAAKTISIESDNNDDPENIATKIQVLDTNAPSENQPQIEKSSENEQGKSPALLELKEKIKEHKANYQALKKYAEEQEALVKKLIAQIESQKGQASNEDRQNIEQLEAQFNQELNQLKQQLAEREAGQKDRKSVV